MTEPVTLAEARKHLRLESDEGDAGEIADAIVAAREWVEEKTGHLLVRRQVAQTFPDFAAYLDLRAWPVAAVESVAYLDVGRVSQTLDPAAYDAAYDAAYGARPARITARAYWPRAGGAVTVTVTAGYADGQVPALFRQAIKLMVGHFYESRGGEDASRGDDMPARVTKMLSEKRRRRL